MEIIACLYSNPKFDMYTVFLMVFGIVTRVDVFVGQVNLISANNIQLNAIVLVGIDHVLYRFRVVPRRFHCGISLIVVGPIG